MTNAVTVQCTINAPVEKVWLLYNTPAHICKWNSASDDWHTTNAIVDLQEGGSFLSTMAAKDGSVSFYFTGIYNIVEKHTLIELTIDDGRNVKTTFVTSESGTIVTTVFEPENENPVTMQQQGWQAILNNFKLYAESTNL
jgi:uncharacterized protein YndB with AHSA1/START domain